MFACPIVPYCISIQSHFAFSLTTIPIPCHRRVTQGELGLRRSEFVEPRHPRLAVWTTRGGRSVFLFLLLFPSMISMRKKQFMLPSRSDTRGYIQNEDILVYITSTIGLTRHSTHQTCAAAPFFCCVMGHTGRCSEESRCKSPLKGGGWQHWITNCSKSVNTTSVCTGCLDTFWHIYIYIYICVYIYCTEVYTGGSSCLTATRFFCVGKFLFTRLHSHEVGTSNQLHNIGHNFNN